MPVIEANGCLINVQIEGSERSPVLMLSNSLGTNLHMWDPQAAELAKHFRLIRYDRRGHGKSAVPPGPYSMEMLGRDVLAILDGLGISKINWCGLSMGGMVGQWLGANAPGRIDKLILSNTSSHYPDKTPWHDRIKAVREGGIGAVADRVLGAWFTKDFIAREPMTVAGMKDMMLSTPPDGYIANCEAVRDMDHREILADIRVPTLVIAGRHDPATPVAAGEFIRSRIPGAAMHVIDAAHIANVEQPHEYLDTVLGFLQQR